MHRLFHHNIYGLLTVFSLGFFVVCVLTVSIYVDTALLITALLIWLIQSTGLTKKFVQFFPYHLKENCLVC